MKMVLKVFLKTVLIFLILNFPTIWKLYHDESIIINTHLGKVRGSLMKTREGKNIFAFRGLNYAEPPIAEQRFKDFFPWLLLIYRDIARIFPARALCPRILVTTTDPIPVSAWKDIRDASKEGPACIQATGINLSEDCLTLNIYTKSTQNQENNILKKSPVIVYLPPGGFLMSSSQSFLCGPRYLLDHDVVLVTVNYRLGFFGFINSGDEYASGNYAFKDQVLALKFVRDDIAAFGGDPNSVTLTGQSAGSRSIVLHMISPMSKGLFHRAIAMSGSPIIPIHPQKEQINLSLKQARLLNCTIESTKTMLTCFRKRPARDFGNSMKFFWDWYQAPHLIWHPAIESNISKADRFLIEDPENLIKQGKINSVPLIIGFTKDEFKYKTVNGKYEYLKGVNKFFKELNHNWYDLAPINFGYEQGTERSKFVSREIYKYYFGNETISYHNSKSLEKLYANSLAHYPIYKTANLFAEYASNPVYLYNFTYQGRYSKRFFSDTKQPSAGVAHGDDLQYLFNIDNDIYTHAEFPIFTESDPEFLMVRRLTTMWAHFAKTNEPLPEDSDLFGNVTWLRYTSKSENFLNIGKEITIENKIQDKALQFLDSLFP